MSTNTAFEMVSEMLSAVGSDEVSAIDDTTEARKPMTSSRLPMMS